MPPVSSNSTSMLLLNIIKAS